MEILLSNKREDEPYKNCKYNTSKAGQFVGYCKHPHNFFDDEHGKGWKLVECRKCPCPDFINGLSDGTS